MPARHPDTVLSWAVARTLAVEVGCDPRTIQNAAKRKPCTGDTGTRVYAALSRYFEDHPELKPEGWAPPPPPLVPPTPAPAKPRPAHLPLPPAVAQELAAKARVNWRTIQRAAAGVLPVDHRGHRALEAVEQWRAAQVQESAELPSAAEV